MSNLLSLSALDGFVKALQSSIGAWYLVLINFIGVIAIFVKVTELQLKKRDNIIKFYIISNVLWILYFLLNADLVGAITCTLGVVQGLIFLQREKKKWARSNFWLVFFLIIQVATFIIFYKSIGDIFSTIAGLLAVVGYFVLSERKYRFLILFSMICWVLNGIFKLYIIALVNDSLTVVSATIAIIRYDVLKKDKKNDNISTVLEENGENL